MFYLVKTPWWLKRLYPGCLWSMPPGGKTLYLTFDDGPHPEATPFVLDLLEQYQAKATFFCIGKNVVEHRHLYNGIVERGHRVGNHTFRHLNGWKTRDALYMADILAAQQEIDSTLFRPPYGRISRFQLRLLQGKFTPVMWSVLSGDFDPFISSEKCLNNVLQNTEDGAIVVFHDSAKALPTLRLVLPEVLKHFAGKGYSFESLKEEQLIRSTETLQAARL
jgi:peptidoglycan/xylan/chitin deacetylase (PgdA/CDA1 family)